MNNLLQWLFFLMSAGIFIRSVSNLKNLISNISWLKRSRKADNRPRSTIENFVICIPMLREQNVVRETLNYFATLNYPKDKYKVIVVTTNKEIAERKDSENDLPTTYNIATGVARKINSKVGRKLVTVLNYPRTSGLMSHQINFVVREIAKSKKDRFSIFAVYNADSRPSRDTLKYVSKAFSELGKDSCITPNIIQQSSLFTLNYNKFPNSLSGYILKASALFQTKWTLVHELTRFRVQSDRALKPQSTFWQRICNTKLSHCVGHGLFVRLNLLSQEYLPTETINEDLPFGYYQCCKREPIFPLSVLENSEAPRNLKSLFNQKRVWFFPYLEYQKCKDRVIRLGLYKNRLEVDLLTLQGQITGIIWFIQSAMFIIPLLITIYLRNMTFLDIYIACLFLYWFVPIAIIYLNLGFLERIAQRTISRRSAIDYFLTSCAGLIVIFTHSLGPILATIDFIKAGLFGGIILKPKTER